MNLNPEDTIISAKPNLKNPVHLLAFGFGSGLAPFAPGTFGTVVGVGLYWLLAGLSLPYYLLVLVVVSVAGIWICGRTAEDLKTHDHSGIVWDEIAGYLVTMIAAPVGWQWMLIGFLLFRFFDVLKPWPISWLDRRVEGGLGIMVDDLLAGVFSLVLLQLLSRSGLLSGMF